MQAEEFHNIYRSESDHFFYRHVHHGVVKLYKKYSSSKNPIILDAGCGTGGLSQKLKEYGEVVGVDINPLAEKYFKDRKMNFIRGSITQLPFSDSRFDVCVCIDVLVHNQVEDDLHALKEVYRVLKPGGCLIVRVAAHPWLYSAHDEYVDTRQRYTKAKFLFKLREAGFKIEYVDFMGFVLIPISLAYKAATLLTPKNKLKSGIMKVPPVLNSLIYWTLKIESNARDLVRLPWGIGLLAVARKPFISYA